MNDLITIYNTLYNIIKNSVSDINTERALTSGEYIFPTIPRGSDKFYPRYTIKILNVEPRPIAAGKKLTRTYNTNNVTDETGYVNDITIWIGVFVKTDVYFDIPIPGGSVKRAKNSLLGNYLIGNLLDAIDSNEATLKAGSYFYNPFDRQVDLDYTEDTSRIMNGATIKLSLLSTTAIVYNSAQLINTINQIYNIQ